MGDVRVLLVDVGESESSKSLPSVIEEGSIELSSEGRADGLRSSGRKLDGRASVEDRLGSSLDEEEGRGSLPSEDGHALPVSRELESEDSGDSGGVVIVDGGGSSERGKASERGVEGVVVRSELLDEDFHGGFRWLSDVGVDSRVLRGGETRGQ